MSHAKKTWIRSTNRFESFFAIKKTTSTGRSCQSVLSSSSSVQLWPLWKPCKTLKNPQIPVVQSYRPACRPVCRPACRSLCHPTCRVQLHTSQDLRFANQNRSKRHKIRAPRHQNRWRTLVETSSWTSVSMKDAQDSSSWSRTGFELQDTRIDDDVTGFDLLIESAEAWQDSFARSTDLRPVGSRTRVEIHVEGCNWSGQLIVNFVTWFAAETNTNKREVSNRHGDAKEMIMSGCIRVPLITVKSLGSDTDVQVTRTKGHESTIVILWMIDIIVVFCSITVWSLTSLEIRLDPSMTFNKDTD